MKRQCIKCQVDSEMPEYRIRKRYYICDICYFESLREWRKKNKTREKLSHKKWSERNVELKREHQRKYAFRNKQKEKERTAIYKKQNPHKVAEWDSKRYLTIKSMGSFTAEEFIQLCNKYGNICLKCKRKVKLTVDHVIPLSKGGLNIISNIQPLCKICNSTKNTKSTDYRLSSGR